MTSTQAKELDATIRSLEKNLNVGDTIFWSGGWGSDEYHRAIVEDIQVDCEGKYGDAVQFVSWLDIELPHCRSVIVTMDNGHWAYGFQIRPNE